MPARDQKLESSFSSPQSPANLGQIRTATTALLLTYPTSATAKKTGTGNTQESVISRLYPKATIKGVKTASSSASLPRQRRSSAPESCRRINALESRSGLHEEETSGRELVVPR